MFVFEGVSACAPLAVWLVGFAAWFLCFQISLRVLACWFLGVDFQVIFQIAMTSEADGSIFCIPDCHLTCPVPPLWRPGGHFGTLGAFSGTMGAAGGKRDGPEAEPICGSHS